MMKTNKNQIAESIFQRLKENKENTPSNSYDSGYIDGMHDALVDVLNILHIEHNEEYYN